MTNPSKSLCVLIIDRSGSMDTIKDATITGLNAFIDEQRGLDGCMMGLVTFSDAVKPLVLQPVKNVARFNATNYVPIGGTRLLDALGITITAVGDYLRDLPEADRPGRISIVVMTDGEENSSRQFTRPQVFSMITEQEKVYSWQFTFLGANQDAIRSGTSMGFTSGKSVDYSANEFSVSSVLRSASMKNTAYLSGAAGASAMDWSAEDRNEVKGEQP